MRRFVVALLGFVLVGMTTVVPAGPANATIHEIVAQWCAGRGELTPAGIQDGKNFAKPVFANGFIGTPFAFTGPDGPGIFIPFNYDVAPAKVVPTGAIANVGSPTAPVYVDVITLDPTFPAFAHCPRLVGP